MRHVVTFNQLFLCCVRAAETWDKMQSEASVMPAAFLTYLVE